MPKMVGKVSKITPFDDKGYDLLNIWNKKDGNILISDFERETKEKFKEGEWCEIQYKEVEKGNKTFRNLESIQKHDFPKRTRTANIQKESFSRDKSIVAQNITRSAVLLVSVKPDSYTLDAATTKLLQLYKKTLEEL